MAYTNIELRETNSNGEYVGDGPALEDQLPAKPPLHKRLLKVFQHRGDGRPSRKGGVQPDDLKYLLDDLDNVLGTDYGASLRRDHAHFKDHAGVELMNSLIWFKCFKPPLVGKCGYLD